MSRNEMIELLVIDLICNWVFARNYDSLKEVLCFGWKGYHDYTDEELKEAIEEFDDEQIRDIKDAIEAEQKRTEEPGFLTDDKAIIK